METTRSTSPTPRRADGLTRRERRVKEMLLRELRKTSDSKMLSYNEIQHLEKRLNPEFIGKELAKIRKQIRFLPKLIAVAGLVMVVGFGFLLWEQFTTSEGLRWRDVVFLLPILSGILSPLVQRKALQRKLFIYEALYELSEANEMDVTLSRVAEEADLLIDKIVERELDIERRMPIRLRA